MCVHVHNGCNGGSYLSSKKLQALPEMFGPAPIAQVLQEMIQGCVRCGHDERKVYHMVKGGSSSVLITGWSAGFTIDPLMFHILSICFLFLFMWRLIW